MGNRESFLTGGVIRISFEQAVTSLVQPVCLLFRQM